MNGAAAVSAGRTGGEELRLKYRWAGLRAATTLLRRWDRVPG